MKVCILPKPLLSVNCIWSKTTRIVHFRETPGRSFSEREWEAEPRSLGDTAWAPDVCQTLEWPSCSRHVLSDCSLQLGDTGKAPTLQVWTSASRGQWGGPGCGVASGATLAHLLPHRVGIWGKGTWDPEPHLSTRTYSWDCTTSFRETPPIIPCLCVCSL